MALTNDPALIGLSDLDSATAAPHQPEAPHATISAEDRAKLKHVFGDLPGLDMDAVIAAALAAPPKASTPADPISEGRPGEAQALQLMAFLARACNPGRNGEDGASTLPHAGLPGRGLEAVAAAARPMDFEF